MGRADRYDTHVKPFLEDIAKWKTSMTEEQISEKLGIAYSTFQKYKQQHDELYQVCLFGNKNKCDEVWSAMYKRAIGYTEMIPKDVVDREGNVTTIMVAHHVPADVRAQLIILANNEPSFHTDDAEVLRLKKEIAELKKQLADKDGDWECLP